MRNQKKILHIVLNNFAPDYRVLKETTALSQAGYAVTLFALWDAKMPRNEVIGNVNVRRFHLRLRSLPKRKFIQFFKFIECVVRMVWAGVRERPQVVHAHDLNGLVIGYLIVQLTGCILIYDSHELWSNSHLVTEYPSWVLKAMVIAERFLVRRCNRAITVSDGIAQAMSNHLGIQRPAVVRNVPESLPDIGTLDLRQELDISSDAIVLLYLGGILPGRGTGLILRAFVRLDNPAAHLVFLGAHELPSWINIYIPTSVASRIHFHPPIHPHQVIPFARGADIGVHAIRGTSESHRLCLPNKLFEYIHAGLAVLVTDLPEMAALVKAKGVGRVFQDGDEDDLLYQMKEMLADRQSLTSMQKATQHAAEELRWENEREILLELYTHLWIGT